MSESAVLAKLAISFYEVGAKGRFVHIRCASQLFIVVGVIAVISFLAVTYSRLAVHSSSSAIFQLNHSFKRRLVFNFAEHLKIVVPKLPNQKFNKYSRY